MGADSWLRTLEPGEKPPPAPGWILEFSTQSCSGICGGLAWGGWRGLLLAREEGVSKAPKQKATNYFVRGALWGGARVGVFAATFSALALTAEALRKKRDAANYGGAGAFCAALFSHRAGLALAFPFTVGGAVAGAALGGLQVELERLTGGKIFETKPEEPELPSVNAEDVAAVVTSIERKLAATSALTAGEKQEN